MDDVIASRPVIDREIRRTTTPLPAAQQSDANRRAIYAGARGGAAPTLRKPKRGSR